MKTRKIPAHEKYPADFQFGQKGWAYSTLEQAMKKYNELLQSEKTIM